MEKMGLAAVLEDSAFTKGLSNYMSGLDKADAKTKSTASGITGAFKNAGASVLSFGAQVAQIGLTAGIAGIGALTAALGFCAKAGMESQDVLAQMDAVLKATSAGYDEAAATIISSTKLSAKEISDLQVDLKDAELNYNTMGAAMQEDKQRLIELTKQWGSEGLAVKTASAKLAESEAEFAKLGGTIDTLRSKIGEGSQVVTHNLADELGLVNPAARLTREQLVGLANEMQKLTKFDDEAVISAESVLLTFTKIGKDTFPKALDITADLAQSLGMDMAQAAKLLGKAIQEPAEGLSALTRYGVRFSDSQIAMIEGMVAAGDAAKAQDYILKQLEIRYGGTAKAAGQTASGQLTIFKNSLMDVAETIGLAVLPSLTSMVSGFITTLQSPGVQGAITGFSTLISQLFSGNIAGAVFSLNDLLAKAFGPEFAAKITATLINIITWVQGTLVPGLQTAFTFLTTTVIPLLVTGFQTVVGWLQTNWPTIQSIIQTVAAAVGQALQFIINTVIPALVMAFQTVSAWVTANWPAISAIIQQVAAVISAALTFVIKTVLPAVIQGFQTVATTVQQNMPLIQSIIQTVMGAVGAAIQFVSERILPFLMSAFEGIVSWVKENWPMISATVTTVLNIIKQVFQDWGPTIFGIVETAWNMIETVIKTVIGVVQGIITVVCKAIQGDWSGMWEAVKDTIKTVWDGIEKIVGLAIEAVKGVIKLLWGALTALDNDLRAAAKNLINTVAAAIVDTLGKKATEIITAAREIGTNIIEGIKGGVESARAMLQRAIDAIISMLPDWVKKILGIASPSTIMYAIGVDFMQGFIDAVSDRTVALVGQVSQVVSDVVSVMENLGKIGEFKPVKDFSGALTNLLTQANEATTIIMDYLSHWAYDAPKWLEQAGKLTGLWAGVLEPLSSLADAVTKVAGYVKSKNPAEAAKALLADADAVSQALMDYFAGWVDATVVMAANAGQALQLWKPIWDGVQGIADGIAAVAGYQAASNLAATTDTLLADAKTVMTRLVDYFALWNDAGRESVDKAAKAAVSMAALFAPARAIADGIGLVADYNTRSLIAEKAAALLDDARKVARAFVLYFQTWTEASYGCMEIATRGAQAMATLMGLVRAIVDGVAGVAGYQQAANIGPAAAGLLQDARMVAREFVLYFQTWQEATYGCMALATRGAVAMTALLGNVKAIVDGVKAVADYAPQQGIGAATAALLQDARAIAHEFVLYFQTWVEATYGCMDLATRGATAMAALMAPVKGIIDGIKAVTGYQAAVGLNASMDALLVDASAIWQRLAFYFGGWAEAAVEYMTPASKAAAAMAALMAPIKGVVDSIKAATGYTAATGLAASVEAMLVDASAIWQRLAFYFQGWAEAAVKELGAAGQAMAATAALMAPVKGIIDSIKALADYKAAADLDVKLDAFFFDLSNIFARLLSAFEDTTPTMQKLYDAVAAAATAVGTIVGSVKNMAEGITALATLPALDPAVMDANMAVLLYYTERFIAAMVAMAGRFATEGVAAAAALAEAGGKVFSMGKAGLDFLDALASFGTEYITPQKIDVVADMVLYVLNTIGWMAYQIAPALTTAAAAFSVYAKYSFDFFKLAADTLNSIAEAAIPDEAKITEFANALLRVLRILTGAVTTTQDIGATVATLAQQLGLPDLVLPAIVGVTRPTAPTGGWPSLPGRPAPVTGGGGGGGSSGGGEISGFADKALVQLFRMVDAAIRSAQLAVPAVYQPATVTAGASGAAGAGTVNNYYLSANYANAQSETSLADTVKMLKMSRG